MLPKTVKVKLTYNLHYLAAVVTSIIGPMKYRAWFKFVLKPTTSNPNCKGCRQCVSLHRVGSFSRKVAGTVALLRRQVATQNLRCACRKTIVIYYFLRRKRNGKVLVTYCFLDWRLWNDWAWPISIIIVRIESPVWFHPLLLAIIPLRVKVFFKKRTKRKKQK